jgi:hypothetical protein
MSTNFFQVAAEVASVGWFAGFVWLIVGRVHEATEAMLGDPTHCRRHANRVAEPRP